MAQSSSLKLLSIISVSALTLTACAGDQEFVPANQAASAQKATKKTLDFSGARPKEITVGPDDTVYGIAYAHGVFTKSLIALNDISSPYVLTPGQILILPQPNEHIVSSGETLPNVAAMYGVKIDALARENEITATAILTPKQRLKIPSADTDPIVPPAAPIIASNNLAPLAIAAPKALDTKSTASTTPKPSLPEDLAKELAMETESQEKDNENVPTVLPAISSATTAVIETPSPPEPKAKAVTPKIETPPTLATAKPPAGDTSKKTKEETKTAPSSEFIWPVQGEVISNFGSKDGKVKNDGINIKVAEGTAVKAAQAGEVIYAGNELKGFGNLVLIKHSNGLKTAYAHNKELLVKKGDKVKQGQTISKSGKTGDVKTPQLHFEIREGTKAIDPIKKLDT